jgi:hypothetical protein
MDDESGDARKTAASAISCEDAARPIGIQSSSPIV